MTIDEFEEGDEMIPTNSRRFPPCLPQSSPPADSSSPDVSASGSSQNGTSDAVNAALQAAESYRRWAAAPSKLLVSEQHTVTLANAFAKQKDDFGVARLLAIIDATADQAELIAHQQKLLDVLLAEWDASNACAREQTLHGKAKAWRIRVDASVAVAQALTEYKTAVQA